MTKRLKELEAKNAFKGEALAKLAAFAGKVEVQRRHLEAAPRQREAGVEATQTGQ